MRLNLNPGHASCLMALNVSIYLFKSRCPRGSKKTAKYFFAAFCVCLSTTCLIKGHLTQSRLQVLRSMVMQLIHLGLVRTALINDDQPFIFSFVERMLGSGRDLIATRAARPLV